MVNFTLKPSSKNACSMRKLSALTAGMFFLCPITLTSCGRSSGQYGTRACSKVENSIRLYDRGVRSTNASTRIRYLTNATELLREALPLAALAAGTSGRWQALQATLSESNRVPESYLVTALEQQCSAQTQNNINIPPSTIPSG